MSDIFEKQNKMKMKNIDWIWHIGGFGKIDKKKCEWSVGCGRWVVG